MNISHIMMINRTFFVVVVYILMIELTDVDTALLINDIASRAGKAKELAGWYGATVDELREFANVNIDKIKIAKDAYDQAHTAPVVVSDQITPTQLDDLWITNKFERLKRLQELAESMFPVAMTGDNTSLREFRSYLILAANELGQLLHRGAGDSGTGDTLSVDIQGIDLENLK